VLKELVVEEQRHIEFIEAQIALLERGLPLASEALEREICKAVRSCARVRGGSQAC
jgi:hypothetical protein